jgi:hypothetical protein
VSLRSLAVSPDPNHARRRLVTAESAKSAERKGRFAFFWFQALAPDLGPYWINLRIDAFLNRPSREKKCASPYMGERLSENGVGGKWLMGALLCIPLTLMGRGNGVLGG